MTYGAPTIFGVTTLEYDSDNRLWKTTDPRSGVETRLYWPDGRIKSVETGAMTKDLALLVGPDQSWLTTEDFLDTLDKNLAARVS